MPRVMNEFLNLSGWFYVSGHGILSDVFKALINNLDFPTLQSHKISTLCHLDFFSKLLEIPQICDLCFL